MKYMERGGFQTQELMRWTLGLTCLLLSGFWVTNFALFFSRLGFTAASIAAYYRGSEAEFRPPRTAGPGAGPRVARQGAARRSRTDSPGH